MLPFIKKIKPVEQQSFIENVFETGLWRTRFVVLLAVIFGLISSLLLFLIASTDVFSALQTVCNYYLFGVHVEHMHEVVLGKIIGAIDFYLIGIVLLIFAFGIYELFISAVDISKQDGHAGALEVHSLNELKDKITKVIVMVLVVNFFQRVLLMDFSTPLDMLYLALAICLLSLGLYLLHKNDEKHKGE